MLLHYAGSRPRYSGKKIRFKLHLDPGENWHACLKWQPQIEGAEKKIETGCHFSGSSRWEHKRVTFLEEAAAFTSPHRADLTGIVLGALEQSKQDLAALRLYDLDEDLVQKDNQHGRGWTRSRRTSVVCRTIRPRRIDRFLAVVDAEPGNDDWRSRGTCKIARQ